MDRDRSKKEIYEIRIEGHLAPTWSEVFDGMRIIQTRNGETILTGAVADQAALHGLLARIRDLNLTLISVIQIKEVGKLKFKHSLLTRDGYYPLFRRKSHTDR